MISQTMKSGENFALIRFATTDALARTENRMFEENPANPRSVPYV